MPKYVKSTPGKHRMMLGGRHILVRPGDEIECETGELGNWEHLFQRVDAEPPAIKSAKSTADPNMLSVRHTGGVWYEILNRETGRPIHDKKIRRKEAEEILQRSLTDEELGKETDKDSTTKVESPADGNTP